MVKNVAAKKAAWIFSMSGFASVAIGKNAFEAMVELVTECHTEQSPSGGTHHQTYGAANGFAPSTRWLCLVVGFAQFVSRGVRISH